MQAASQGLTNRQIAKDDDLEEHRVIQWRTRWHEFHEHWTQPDPELRPKMSVKLVRKWLADAEGRGAKPERCDGQDDCSHVACDEEGRGFRQEYIVEKSQSVFDGEEPPDTLCF